MYLMVAYLKFCGKLDLSIQPIIRLFQVTYLSEQTCGDYSKETLQRTYWNSGTDAVYILMKVYGTAMMTYTLRFCARCFLALTKQ